MDQAASELSSDKGSANYAWACIRLAMCDFRSAATFAQRAIRCFEDVEMRVWSGRARLIAGRAHALAGEHAAAVGELESAHSILHNAGAAGWRDEAAKELRGLGIRVRRRSFAVEPADMSSLTERERSIAERVAQGYTNREIAAQVFVSPKPSRKSWKAPAAPLSAEKIRTALAVRRRAEVAERTF
ncbi:LuxR C-terminal-related transcriptional regulator [Nocardia rhamnosiphila]